MNSDARRRASAAFQAKREAEGWRKVTLWMHPDTLEELNRLAKVYGTKGEAVAKCINHHSHEARRKEAAQRARYMAVDAPPATPPVPGSLTPVGRLVAIDPVTDGQPPAPKASGIQIGPVARKPGDLMKKGKK